MNARWPALIICGIVALPVGPTTRTGATPGRAPSQRGAISQAPGVSGASQRSAMSQEPGVTGADLGPTARSSRTRRAEDAPPGGPGVPGHRPLPGGASWRQQAELTAPGGAPQDHFGNTATDGATGDELGGAAALDAAVVLAGTP